VQPASGGAGRARYVDGPGASAMSADIQRVGDLEIPQDHDFQRLNWSIQRHAWVGMAVLLLLGLLGLFGPGPLSDATVGDDAGPLRLEYQRFGRLRAPSTLVADLRPGRGAAGGEARLWLSRDYLGAIQIQRIDPVPGRVEAGPLRSAYVFRLIDPARPTRVTVHFRPEKIGRIRARVGLDDSAPLDFAQLVYP
jgi:hypothetical protein